jgi:hypothetical protein
MIIIIHFLFSLLLVKSQEDYNNLISLPPFTDYDDPDIVSDDYVYAFRDQMEREGRWGK